MVAMTRLTMLAALAATATAQYWRQREEEKWQCDKECVRIIFVIVFQVGCLVMGCWICCTFPCVWARLQQLERLTAPDAGFNLEQDRRWVLDWCKSNASYSRVADKEETTKLVRFAKSSRGDDKLGFTYDGPVVTSVEAGGMAERLGVKVGWTMLRVNGKPYTHDELIKAVQAPVPVASGRMLQILFELPMKLKISTAIDFSPEERLGLGYEGAEVISVQEGGQAARNGVKVGWQMKTIKGAIKGPAQSTWPYSAERLVIAATGDKPYTITFEYVDEATETGEAGLSEQKEAGSRGRRGACTRWRSRLWARCDDVTA